ncbi:crotonyl-CoA carboxylase/reductase [Streptomyces atratus]|uniref:Crotonyl-CoA carboxylase/reductase n=1 Tax=Streptomyces atratus TaxID=1893 RepID=A0A2Z5JNB9_STRAR|nr:crotonyl-CoA carboxylase/reductase [Streptomyces atratus]AXE81853.1 crotonyl-CoA carboxylase/reductase [Streptomyces atratus]WPW33100.1 crotonyl-CoA carboxylase/reductase [Streptomyces atratus]GGT53261.1 crotonyl-CoA carboxylase/reductase [Streptomyces atratus]
MGQDIYEIGEIPPLGEVPRYMHAAMIRQERYGAPADAIRIEQTEVPPVGRGQILLLVMAAGVNYNGVWAALGAPADVIAARRKQGDPHDFHIAGSEGAGVVWAVGEGVTQYRVGDEVIVGGVRWDESAPDIRLGTDPTASRSQRAWGYELNYGSFAQFTVVDEYQCHPKPPRLTWEEAGCFLGGGSTSYRMLTNWHPHHVRPGDPVLIWGGSGGLGSMAIQIVNHFGGIPVAVVSDDAKRDHCMRLGAHGVVNRNEFTHWGGLPGPDDTAAYGAWLDGARSFGRRIWEVLGERRSPRIVLEHPGRDTLATSVYVCDNAGMVVTCAGTSGYIGHIDLRFVWMFQKRLQGSHAANVRETRAIIDLVAAGRVDPCLSETVPFEEIGRAHQQVYENRHAAGNTAVLVNAPGPGLTGMP